MNLHIRYLSAIIALISGLFLLGLELKKSNQKNHEKDGIINEKNSVISYHVNNEGRLVAEKEAAIGDFRTLQNAYPKLIEQAKKSLEIKNKKDIVSLTQTSFDSQGSGRVPLKFISGEILGTAVVRVDSGTLHTLTLPKKDLVIAVAQIDDGYLKMNGFIKSGDMMDYFDYKYDYIDTLTTGITKHWRPFKGTEISVKGSLQNPNARITHITGITTERVKPKKMVISAGLYYDPIRNQSGFSINAGFPLISF
jgi:hypothetical protein